MAAPTAPRLLVVDDNPATLYSNSHVLRAADFAVTEGINGEQALERALNTDLLLLDVNLPDIHGFEVCRRLRGDPRTARLPVIRLSATFVKEIDKAQGLDAGGGGFLTPPVEPPLSGATVYTLLGAPAAPHPKPHREAQFHAASYN